MNNDYEQDTYRDEVYSRRVPAGKRTYFLDVKSTRAGDDFFITITERKRLDDGRQEKYRVFLYKEDFGKFIRAMHDVMHHIKEECLPEHDFERLPELTGIDGESTADGEKHVPGENGVTRERVREA